uniref:C2H2-type domain-containing protein n=1 Tax=Glossina pallidipes TaxID=7398 RepID=A0A1A9ZJP4_GLOPL
MPQRLCVKCANLLKNIYVFLLEAEKLNEIYLDRARSIKIVIKSEDCLQELPIDLPQAPETSVDIKTEPPEINVGVGTEPQLSKCLSSFDGLTEETKQEQLRENVKSEINQNEEYFLNDLNLRRDHDEDTKSSNALEEQSTGDPCKGKKIYIKPTDQDTNKEIKYNRPAFQQHVAVRCELCDKIYKNCKTLAAHKFYTHMNDEEKLRCALCDFKTSRITCLKIHMTTIHGPKFAEKSIKPMNA